MLFLTVFDGSFGYRDTGFRLLWRKGYLYGKQQLPSHITSRLDVSINGFEDTEALATVSLDTELIHKKDTEKAIEAARQLLDSGGLTEVQRRRFLLHFFQGLSIRQIAALEEVDYRAVWDSLYWASKKFKKFFYE